MFIYSLFRLFSHVGYCRVLSRVLSAIQYIPPKVLLLFPLVLKSSCDQALLAFKVKYLGAPLLDARPPNLGA